MVRKTLCNEQIKRFVDRSRHIFAELGEWAADYYICTSVEQLRTFKLLVQATSRGGPG